MKTNIINTIGTTALVAIFVSLILLFTVFSNGIYIAHF